MKLRKGICLVLCILLLTALVPRAAAVSGESVDGVWASIALTGGANKVIFSADSEVEEQILHPDELTDAQYLLPEGAEYDAATNTLSLTDFDGATANLVLTMMGSDFRLSLAGSSTLASIRSESMGRGGSITLCGDGELEILSSGPAILVRAGGASDFVRIEPQVKLNAQSAEGSAIRVENTALSSDAILFDTSVPELRPFDASAPLEDQRTTDEAVIDVCTLPGEEGLFGLEYVIDPETESFVYNVYALGEKDGEGRYEAELLEEGVADVSAYEAVYTPHDWTIRDAYSAAPISRVRFARFAVTASATEGGTLSLSQSAVGRGGSVTVSAVPEDGFKLVSLSVNGEEVSPVNGSYTIAGITSDKSVEAVFAEASAVEIEISAPENTAFTVPGDSEEPFVSAPFTAVVKDGAGDAVGATVLWSVEPKLEGVSIGEDGRVTVSSAVMNAASEGLSFTVTAALAEPSLTQEGGSFTVSLAERRAAEIHLTRSGEALGESDTLWIPAAGETTTQRYGAVVFDQYGAAREEEILWSAGDWPIGVSRSGDTLTVTDACREGSSLVVTAAAASDSEVSSSVTVSFVEKPVIPENDEEEGASALPGVGGALSDTNTQKGAPIGEEEEEEEEEQEQAQEEEASHAAPSLTAAPTRSDPPAGTPVISWPDFTLAAAQERVYGVTWAELVTLSDNGSATLGETPLEGSFHLNKNWNDLPNVSDSFKLVFSYGENDDAQSIECDEAHAVTLARRSLDDTVLTLSPDETWYTGSAITPAVSLRDGTRPMQLGTDFEVTGYTNNVEIGVGGVSVAGLGNYSGTASGSFAITPIPGSAVTASVNGCKPEDPGTRPTVVLQYGTAALSEGTDYTLSLQYDVPARTGTATVTFKGHYSGTRALGFDLPNYLITEGANSVWSKSSFASLPFKANGALVKFTELTVDGRTVPTSYYETDSGSTVVKIKPDYLKGLSAGKHIVGIAYQDGKALAIFSVSEDNRRGVITGDSNDLRLWVGLLAGGVFVLCLLAWAFLRSGRKKKKKKTGKK